MKKKWKLIQTMRIYSQDIGTEFGIQKFALQIIRTRKRQITEGIEQSNEEKIRTHGEKETYKYLEIFQVDTIRQVEMKEKN